MYLYNYKYTFPIQAPPNQESIQCFLCSMSISDSIFREMSETKRRENVCIIMNNYSTYVHMYNNSTYVHMYNTYVHMNNYIT